MYLLLIFTAGFLIYLYFYTNSVTEQEINIHLNKKLNKRADSHTSRECAESNFTILHLSDFHFTSEGLLEDKIKKKIAELDYDLVALTGDYLEDSSKMADFFRYLDSLKFTAPVVAVPGNHDYNNHFNDLKLRFERRGFKFLHNESLTYYHDSCRINLIGVGSPNRGRDNLERALQRWRPEEENFVFDEDILLHDVNSSNQAQDRRDSFLTKENLELDKNQKDDRDKNQKNNQVKNQNDDREKIRNEGQDKNQDGEQNKKQKDEQDKKEINIILSHTHGIVNSLEEKSDGFSSSEVDLILTGDTHGGQINIPLLSRFIIPLAFNRDSSYIAGRYNHGGTVIYINRGLGTTILPLRFNSRPEITIIRLRH